MLTGSTCFGFSFHSLEFLLSDVTPMSINITKAVNAVSNVDPSKARSPTVSNAHMYMTFLGVPKNDIIRVINIRVLIMMQTLYPVRLVLPFVLTNILQGIRM